MRKLFLGLLLACLLAGTTWAAVQVLDDGTKVSVTDKINFVGATITHTGTIVEVDTTYYPASAMAGNFTVTGGVTINASVGIGTGLPQAKLHVGAGTPTKATSVTTDAYVLGKIEVDGNLYVDNAIYVDDSVYGKQMGINWKAVTTCGCKTFVDGLCVEKGTCS
jgi:hypothetical protein